MPTYVSTRIASYSLPLPANIPCARPGGEGAANSPGHPGGGAGAC
jgi:hypothetical protein